MTVCVCVCEAGGGVCVVLSSSGALETASMSVMRVSDTKHSLSCVMVRHAARQQLQQQANCQSQC